MGSVPGPLTERSGTVFSRRSVSRSAAPREDAIRVALVHARYRGPSGENVVVDSERTALARRGVEVRSFEATPDPSFTGRVRAAAQASTGLGADPLQEISEWGADVVHIHNLFPWFGRRWVAELGVPHVVTLHNYRSVCAAGTFFRDGRLCTDCPDLGHHHAVRHECYSESALATIPVVLGIWRGPSSDPVLTTASRILAVSELQRDLLARKGMGKFGVEVAHNFVPNEFVPSRAFVERREHNGRWIFVGRLSVEKGIAKLLQAWPDGRPLDIVGDGPARASVERFASRLRGVTIHGPLPREETLERIHAAVGVVFPSIWPETFGLVYPEAMAAGVPVIATDPSAVGRWVDDHGTGLSVPLVQDDLDAAMSRLESEDDEGRRLARRDVFDRLFSEDSIVPERIQMYSEVVTEAQRSS